jgi:hypothetical protein
MIIGKPIAKITVGNIRATVFKTVKTTTTPEIWMMLSDDFISENNKVKMSYIVCR